MNWFKAIVWIKGIKILLVIIIDYISFKDSFGYKKFNFVFISHFYLIAAENIFIQTAESTCCLKITAGTTTTKRLHFYFSTKIYLTWMKILKWIFYNIIFYNSIISMSVGRKDEHSQSEVKYQLLKSKNQIYHRCTKVLLILQKPWRF